jgi:hypothetical protein
LLNNQQHRAISTEPEYIIMTEAVSEAAATNTDTTATKDEPVLVRTAAFLADERTSDFLLPETISSLITRQGIEHGLVDLSTRAGVVVAQQFDTSGIAYSIFNTDPLTPSADFEFDLKALYVHAKAILPFNPENVTDIDANIVLITAPADDGGPGIDATDGAITNLVIEQVQQTKLNCLMVLPPESGLRRQNDGSYVRLTLKLAE